MISCCKQHHRLNMTRIHYNVFLILFSLFTLLGCEPADADQYRSVVINDVGLKIPIEFYHPLAVPTADNEDDTSVLLNVELPDIEYLKQDQALYLREARLQGTKMRAATMLIGSPFNENGSSRQSLAARLQSRIERNVTTKQNPDLYGLRYLTWPEDAKRGRHEIFYDGDYQIPTTIFGCHEIEGYAPEPQCEMQFYFKTLIVKINFRREDWLPMWRSLKDNASVRLEEFHVAYLQEQQKTRD